MPGNNGFSTLFPGMAVSYWMPPRRDGVIVVSLVSGLMDRRVNSTTICLNTPQWCARIPNSISPHPLRWSLLMLRTTRR